MSNVSSIYQQPHPEQPEEQPEADFFKSVCHNNEWSPQEWGLDPQDFASGVSSNDPTGSYVRVFNFISDYQKNEGGTPPWDLLVAKYPLVAAASEDVVPLSYAVRVLRESIHHDEMRRQGILLLRAIESGDYQTMDVAFQSANAALKSHPSSDLMDASSQPGDHAWDDDELYDSSLSQPLFATTSHALNRALAGGFQPGSLNLVGALPGVGKSFWLAQRAVEAAESGLRVCVFSLEMSAREYAQRMQKIVLNRDVTTMPDDMVREQCAEWGEEVKRNGGEVVYAGLDGLTSPAKIRKRLPHFDVVIVDYAGLLRADSGESHAESHNAAAQVANELMEAVQQFSADNNNHRACLLVAVQLSKLARVPKGISDVGKNLQAIADSMAYSRNNHTFTTLHSDGLPPGLRIVAVEKNRHGSTQPPWYETFNPNVGDFSEITYERARTMIDRAQEETYD